MIIPEYIFLIYLLMLQLMNCGISLEELGRWEGSNKNVVTKISGHGTLKSIEMTKVTAKVMLSYPMRIHLLHILLADFTMIM